MKIKSFKCNDNLSQYVDSMLFDNGVCIAEMECEFDNGDMCTISLEVRGEVNVDFNETTYRSPSEFPDELKNIIKENRLWDCESCVYVDMNNWFEYMFTVKDDKYQYTDGVMCEWDISKGTPEDIKKEMIEICEWIAENL
jgi:hypothetical protein